MSFLCSETVSSEMYISELGYSVGKSTNFPNLKIFLLFALLKSKCSKYFCFFKSTVFSNSTVACVNSRKVIFLFCFHYAAKIVHYRNKIEHWDSLRLFLFYQQDENDMFLFCVQNKKWERLFLFTYWLTCRVTCSQLVRCLINNLQ